MALSSLLLTRDSFTLTPNHMKLNVLLFYHSYAAQIKITNTCVAFFPLIKFLPVFTYMYKEKKV